MLHVYMIIHRVEVFHVLSHIIHVYEVAFRT